MASDDQLTRAERDYNYHTISKTASKLGYDPVRGVATNHGFERFRSVAKLGDPVPDVEGVLLDGAPFRFGDYRGRLVYLTFGSITCPPCVFNIRWTKPSLAELYEQFHPRGIEFLCVYTNERHPGEKLTGHTSFEHKIAYARRFKEEDQVPFPIVVDSLDGRIHKALGGRPNMSYVINAGGTIVYKAEWTHPADLPSVFENLIEWRDANDSGSVLKIGYSERFTYLKRSFDYDPRKAREIFERSGMQSAEDIAAFMGVDPFSWKSTK